MMRHLSQLLGVSEKQADKFIGKLESLSGYPSEDIRLLSEVRLKARNKLESLNLDPDDTTPAELHHSLLRRLETDIARLGKSLGLAHRTEPDELNKLVLELAAKTTLRGEVMALKKSAARDLLRVNPPKRLMKYLNYRSIESMLKRENVAELYAALPLVESKRWQAAFWNKHLKLKPQDFETRRMEFVMMPAARWEALAPQAGLVTCMLQLGAAAVWPPKVAARRAGLGLFLIVCQAGEIMSIYSSALRREHFNQQFGRKMLELMQNNLVSPVIIESLPVPWSSLHRFFGRQPENLGQELMGTELGAHHGRWAEHMSGLHPAFGWWSDSHYTANLAGGRAVSLNLADVLASYTDNLPAERPSSHHLSKSLFDELMARYLKYPAVQEYVLGRLDTDSWSLAKAPIIVPEMDLRSKVEAEFA